MFVSCRESLVVLHFWASWAPQCKQINDVLTELGKTKDFGAVKYFQIDAEKLPEITKKYNVSSVPTCLLVAKNSVVAVVEGADVTGLTKKIKEVAFKQFPFTVQSIPTSVKDRTSLNDRLKELVNQSKVMVFIKGSPAAPRCGFTRQLIQILDERNIEYGSFDILSDEEVRQGLKTYSNWPTYPQLYVNGILIGGLDIVKELIESGELVDTLNA